MNFMFGLGVGLTIGGLWIGLLWGWTLDDVRRRHFTGSERQ